MQGPEPWKASSPKTPHGSGWTPAASLAEAQMMVMSCRAGHILTLAGSIFPILGFAANILARPGK